MLCKVFVYSVMNDVILQIWIVIFMFFIERDLHHKVFVNWTTRNTETAKSLTKPLSEDGWAVHFFKEITFISEAYWCFHHFSTECFVIWIGGVDWIPLFMSMLRQSECKTNSIHLHRTCSFYFCFNVSPFKALSSWKVLLFYSRCKRWY